MTAPPADVVAALGALQQRLEVLEAESGIRDLLHRYGPGLDYGDDEAWLDCFSADAIWEIEGAGARRTLRLQGHEELRAWAATHTRAPEARHKHVIVDPVIEVDGDRATSQAYFLRVDGFAEGPVLQSIGRYVDDLVRGSDGRWRFAHRRVDCDSTRPSPWGSGRRTAD